jgi:TonB family protein
VKHVLFLQNRCSFLIPYPLASLIETEAGRVALNLIVDTEGHIIFAQRLASSGSDRLDQIAADVAKTRWQFQPATKAGQPVVGSVGVELTWKLPLRPADDYYSQMMGISVTGRSVVPPMPI